MMKVIKIIGVWIFWFVFWCIPSGQKRLDYLRAKDKGMDCIVSKTSFFGGSTVYEFMPNTKPKKRYIEWKEFKQLYNIK